jgi:hypothetical protein
VDVDGKGWPDVVSQVEMSDEDVQIFSHQQSTGGLLGHSLVSDRTVRARGASAFGTLMLERGLHGRTLEGLGRIPDSDVREESALVELKGKPSGMDEDKLVVVADIHGRVLVESLVDTHDGSLELVPVARLSALGGVFDVLSQEEMGEDLMLDLSRQSVQGWATIGA